MSLGPNCTCAYCGARYYSGDGHDCKLAPIEIARRYLERTKQPPKPTEKQ